MLCVCLFDYCGLLLIGNRNELQIVWQSQLVSILYLHWDTLSLIKKLWLSILIGLLWLKVLWCCEWVNSINDREELVFIYLKIDQASVFSMPAIKRRNQLFWVSVPIGRSYKVLCEQQQQPHYHTFIWWSVRAVADIRGDESKKVTHAPDMVHYHLLTYVLFGFSFSLSFHFVHITMYRMMIFM